MKVVDIDVEKLNEAHYNPRKISNKQMEDLKESIRRFGMTEPIVVNNTPERSNIIVSGHQRLKACKELNMKKVPCYLVALPEDKEMELNIRMNKSGGQFDFNILEEFFDKEELLGWGFIDSEFPTIIDVDEFNDVKDEDPVYPIVPVLSEKYDYVIVFATNEIDNAFLNNFFEIEKEASYKNSRIGIGKVVDFDKFRNIVNKLKDERNS